MNSRPRGSRDSPPRFLDAALEWGILALVIFSPLPRASVQSWSVLVIQLAVLALTVLYLMISGEYPANERLQSALKGTRALALGILALLAIQLIPWPGFLLKILSPKTVALSSQYGLSSSARAISLVPAETVRAGSELVAYFLLGFLVLRTLTSARRVRRLFGVIIAMGLFEALYGILRLNSGIFGLSFGLKGSGVDELSGTFVTRNHYSGYLAMIIPLAVGMIVARLGHISLSGLTWREKFLTLTKKGFLSNLPLAFMAIAMSIAVVVSRSRSGIASIVLTLMFFFVFATPFKRKAHERKTLIRPFVRAMVLIMFVLSFAFGFRSSIQRFSPDLALREGRSIVWTQTIRWIGEFPVFGTGLGTFSSSRPGTEIGVGLTGLDHANNEYLEYLMELGAAGFILFLALILSLLGRSLIGWQSRSDPEVRGLALGGFVSCLSVLFHSATDFSLHIPANALLFSVTLSATVAAAFLRKEPERPLP